MSYLPDHLRVLTQYENCEKLLDAYKDAYNREEHRNDYVCGLYMTPKPTMIASQAARFKSRHELEFVFPNMMLGPVELDTTKVVFDRVSGNWRNTHIGNMKLCSSIHGLGTNCSVIVKNVVMHCSGGKTYDTVSINSSDSNEWVVMSYKDQRIDPFADQLFADSQDQLDFLTRF